MIAHKRIQFVNKTERIKFNRILKSKFPQKENFYLQYLRKYVKFHFYFHFDLVFSSYLLIAH